ncbi:MAG TPA: cupin domain-containing protein [Azospirillaceae bacterium]|nr:cupin domain-containing protein [Azospirillaceae bacterium]
MTKPITDFAELIAPITPEEFFAEYHGKKPLHIKAASPDKLAGVMGWDVLSDLVNQTRIWSSSELVLVLDHKTVPPQEYCRLDVGRNGAQAYMADPERVKLWLRRGASMVLNDIDTLTPGLRAVSDTLEVATGGKVEANLYCSWKAHPAFDTHFDTHDVFALHIAGEKTWRLYQRHIEDPIEHPAFKGLGKDFHDRHKGRVSMEVTLKPGDVLYFPRGWYHDALASSAATFHVTFSVTPFIGLDVMSLLFEGAVQDPLFRRALPPAGDREAVAAHLTQLGDRLAKVVREPAALDQVLAAMAGRRQRRGGLTLPDDGLVRIWRKRADNIRLVDMKGQKVLTNGTAGAPIPPGTAEPIKWILARPEFAEADFKKAFPAMGEAGCDRLLNDLARMSVIGLA